MNIPIGKLSGSDATRELQKTIQELAAANEASTKQMLQLTLAMTWLTVVMLVLAVVQVAVALAPLVSGVSS